MASRTSGVTDTAPLSWRERQVAELIAWGAAKKEVPELLRKLYGGALISVHTVENITRSIYAKIHLNKANELSAWWFCRYYGVDSSLSPLKRIREAVIAVLLLIVMIPQTVNPDFALRPSRTRTVRIERRKD